MFLRCLFMNNKGFTLVELLAVIVILAALGGIATYGVISAINASKNRAEDAFLEEISKSIDSYIALNSGNFKKTNTSYKFEKTVASGGGTVNSYFVGKDATAYLMSFNGGTFTLKTILDAGLIDSDSFKNPKSKLVCNKNTNINVYMDNDFVYYYYVDFSTAGCEVTEGKVINTLPDALSDVLHYTKYSLN